MARKLTEDQKALYEKLTPLQKHCANGSIAGKTAVKFYTAACKKIKKKPAKNGRAAGNQIITKPAVKAYIQSVLKPQTEKEANNAIMTRDEILESFSREARASIGNIMNFREGIVGFMDDDENTPIHGMMLYFRDKDDISKEDLALISEISVSAKGVVKIKMACKQKAKKEINLMQGYEAAAKFQLVDDDKELTPWDNVSAGVDS